MTMQEQQDDNRTPAKTKVLISLFVAAALAANTGCASGGRTVPAGSNPYAGQGNVCWDENKDGYCDDDGSKIDRNYNYNSGGYPYFGRLPGTIGSGTPYSGGMTSGQRPPVLSPSTGKSTSPAPSANSGTTTTAPDTTARTGSFSSKSAAGTSSSSGSMSSGSAPKGGIGSSSSGSFGG